MNRTAFIIYIFCTYCNICGALEIMWKGITQTLLSETDFQLRYRAMLPIAEKIPVIGFYMPAILPKSHHEFKEYTGYSLNGKRKFGLKRFFIHHVKTCIFSPFSLCINGANHVLFSLCRFCIDYVGARLQHIYNRTYHTSGLNNFLLMQSFLLSGVNLRTDNLSSAVINRFYLFEYFCGILLHNGLIMLFITKRLSPMMKKISFYKTFDRFLKHKLQKPTINALNRYLFDPIMEKVIVTRRKSFLL